jgi:hypothetical protein
VWWCGGVVVWWCGGVVVWWCGVVVFLTDNNTTPTKIVLSCFGLLVGLWQQTKNWLSNLPGSFSKVPVVGCGG